MTSPETCRSRPAPSTRSERGRAAAIVTLLAAAAISAAPPRGESHSPSPAVVRLCLDVNTASGAELALLPEIGPALASRIVDYRETAAAQPAFRDASDLDAVRGIGPATIERVRPYLRFRRAGDERVTRRAGVCGDTSSMRSGS